jgi:small neutral amino acid transporter SnatA (MarC family)
VLLFIVICLLGYAKANRSLNHHLIIIHVICMVVVFHCLAILMMSESFQRFLDASKFAITMVSTLFS